MAFTFRGKRISTSARRVAVLSRVAVLGCGVILACSSGSTERSVQAANVPADMGAEPSTTGTSVPPGDVTSGDAGVAPPSCVEAPELRDADAQQLFDLPHVPTFDFTLPESDWLELQENARDEQYVRAQACFDGQLIGEVGLRFKGYYGSLYGCYDENDELVCSRLSMKVKFDEYVEDQRFYGLKRLNFNAYRHDDSRLRERLSYDLFREMGIVAPRVTWAVLRVNGESKGLYGLVEQIDGRFTADRWPDSPDGNLYKELWPSQADEYSALDALRTNEEQADVSAFSAFGQAIRDTKEQDRLATLGRFMDTAELARYMAVDDAVANYDGVTYFWTDRVTNSNHNFYIYEHSSERFVLLPWDVEATFWINPDHTAPHWTVLPEDCEQTYPYWEGLALAPACDPILRALGTDLEPWRAAARELLDGPFAEGVMLENIERHAAFIREAAQEDPTPPMYTTFEQAVAELRRVVPALRERLTSLVGDE